ncbi:hypothetical protein DMN91_009110 [Ooceraea biroi]|uniref:Uncharacterized protein n=1 Tax=Ooceraea biroi TaxID=2015173 RepID=A0A3L8DF16_OOCBI|nr:hypothetical protein DMN91_009110 [Ooceraea biroi]
MLLPYVLLFLPVLAVLAQEPSRSMKTLDRERMLRSADGASDALDWIGESFLDVVDAFLPASKLRGTEDSDYLELQINKLPGFIANTFAFRFIIIIIIIIIILLFSERKKKLKLNKYVLPLIVGFVLIKSILLPIALKTLAILSGKAVVLSLMSLILAAIIGLKKVAQKEGYYDGNKHRRQDTVGQFDFVTDPQEFEPYRFYITERR